jgi:hypothetical protein
VVEFNDVDGTKRSLYFPVIFQDNPSFTVHHFVPDDKHRELILTAAQVDRANPAFGQGIGGIPAHERVYTWRAVNADGDLTSGQSLGLPPAESVLAHAILLNKFLLAADALQCIPITGKSYIHGLLSEKYRTAVASLDAQSPRLLPPSLKPGSLRHNPVLTRIVSALVPDEHLERRTDAEIVEFKHRHRDLFERYSYVTRKLLNQVSALPLAPDFDTEVDALIDLEVWKEKADVEERLRSAWGGVFKSAIKSAVGGLAAVGIVPFLSLGAMTLATVAAAASALTPWAVTELVAFLAARKRAQENGLYYLMKFGGA